MPDDRGEGEEIQSESGSVAIFPNPVHDELTVRADQAQRLEIFDTAGRLVSSFDGPTELISTENLVSGMYFLRVELAGGKIEVLRFVKN